MLCTKTLQTVSLGGAPPVLMNIEIATEVTDEVKKLPCWDGIIGMGFKGLNRGKNSNEISRETATPNV